MNDPDLLALLRWVFEALSLAALLAALVWLKMQLDDIPERIPVHFGITGKPDRWGGRWHLALYVAFLLAVYIGMSIAGGTPDLFAGQIQTQATERFILSYVKCGVVLMFFYVFWITIRVARGQASRFNLFVPLGMVVLTLIPSVLLTSK